MSKYKRLTSDVGFARNLPINEELYDRLYELENAIEHGTLIELPCKVGNVVYEVFKNHKPPFGRATKIEKIIITEKGLRLKLSRNSVYETAISALGKTLFLTEAEAQAKLNSLKDEFAECRDCPAWSGSDCTRHPYNEGCLKEVNKEKNDNDL